MNTSNNPSQSLEFLVSAVEADPNNWEARKAAAAKLYVEEKFLEAADMVWGAPEMPSVDVEVAFAVKIVSRARPNRSIRLVYEVLRRNAGKAEQNMAMARAFSMIGLPMLASRFYGAALADGSQNFDIGFEQQSLWYDDSGILLETWANSDQDVKPPFSKKVEDFVGDPISLKDLPDEVSPASVTTSVVHVSKPAGLAGAPVMRAATEQTAPQPVSKPSSQSPAPAPAPAKPTQQQPVRPSAPMAPPAKTPGAGSLLKPAVKKPGTPPVLKPAQPGPAKPPVVRPPKPDS